MTRKATILFKDKPAGILEEIVSGGCRFVYAPEWQTQIACCFPITRREHEWATGLHPFFEHLGTEGWLREKKARVAQIQEEDDLGLLLKYGTDCIGAVSVKPEDVEYSGAEVTEATANPGRTVSGVQKKLLVVKSGDHFSPATATGPAPYIAKFNSKEIDSLVRNEQLSLRWTTAVLGKEEVTAFCAGKVDTLNEQALIVERFDRTDDGKKLRLEDFAQILGIPRGRDYEGKYNAAYEDVAKAIKAHSARALIDLKKFFERIIVFALIGNCDAHLKNFSLLETTAGLRLSPVYDVLNTAFYPNYDQNFALSISGQKRPLDSITRELLENFGLEIGLPKAAIDQTFKDLTKQVEKAAHILQPPLGEGPDGFKTRYSEIVENACLRILNK